MSILHEYQDRKKLKWMSGFFLSDHTSALHKQASEEANVIEPKPTMTLEDIGTRLSEAQLKNKSVAVQLDIQLNESYLPDVIGKVSGYDETAVYVGTSRIEYDEIRNVEFHEDAKWFEV